MSEYEASECIKNCEFVDRNYREIMRYQLYVSVQSNSKKKLSPEDIISLPWDDKYLDKKEFDFNANDDNRLASKGLDYENLLNSNLKKKKEKVEEQR